MSATETELVSGAQSGRRLSYAGAPPTKAVAERMLEVPTRLILEGGERNPALAALDLERELDRLEHEWVPYRGLLIHLERHEVDREAPTVVVTHGLGDHARRHLGLATALAEHGYNSLLIDRQGHGLSEGRRGDSSLESDLGVLELAIGLARERTGGPVIALGDSLGGIVTWYLLTREPDVDAAICHCIGHPDVHPDPSFRFKQPILRALATVAPTAPIPVRRIADYDEVALDPVTKRYFDDEIDAQFNFKVSARSLASFLAFEPGIGWDRVSTPVLVLIGGADRMVTPELTRESLERDRPPHAEYLEIPGAGHQLFLDDLGSAIGPLADGIEATVRGAGDKVATLS